MRDGELTIGDAERTKPEKRIGFGDLCHHHRQLPKAGNEERLGNRFLAGEVLVEGGRARDEAYRIVQELAQRAWDEGTPLRELLAADERAAGLDLDQIFDPSAYLRHAVEILGRLDQIA